jgi:arsenite methyltransferase
MSATPSHVKRPDYGIDAPGVVRNLFIVGVIGLLAWGVGMLGVWSGQLIVPMPGLRLVFPLGDIGLWLGIGFTLMGVGMVWNSKIGKVLSRERLLAQITWTGNEQVLDVGCGRGLMLIGAAKHITTGKATGIDIWQAEDLSGNCSEATLENARREGVLERVEVQSADMRQIPFPDRTFDVVVSRAAIHNLYQAADRAQAIREIARVLKPGGQALIADIRHHGEYAAIFSQSHCTDIRRVGSVMSSALLALITFGSLRPATLVVRKSG